LREREHWLGLPVRIATLGRRRGFTLTGKEVGKKEEKARGRKLKKGWKLCPRETPRLIATFRLQREKRVNQGLKKRQEREGEAIAKKKKRL